MFDVAFKIVVEINYLSMAVYVIELFCLGYCKLLTETNIVAVAVLSNN